MASPTPSTRLATHLERVDHLVANAETAQQGLKDLERILKEMETSRPPSRVTFRSRISSSDTDLLSNFRTKYRQNSNYTTPIQSSIPPPRAQVPNPPSKPADTLKSEYLALLQSLQAHNTTLERHIAQWRTNFNELANIPLSEQVRRQNMVYEQEIEDLKQKLRGVTEWEDELSAIAGLKPLETIRKWKQDSIKLQNIHSQLGVTEDETSEKLSYLVDTSQELNELLGADPISEVRRLLRTKHEQETLVKDIQNCLTTGRVSSKSPHAKLLEEIIPRDTLMERWQEGLLPIPNMRALLGNNSEHPQVRKLFKRLTYDGDSLIEKVEALLDDHEKQTNDLKQLQKLSLADRAEIEKHSMNTQQLIKDLESAQQKNTRMPELLEVQRNYDSVICCLTSFFAGGELIPPLCAPEMHTLAEYVRKKDLWELWEREKLSIPSLTRLVSLDSPVVEIQELCMIVDKMTKPNGTYTKRMQKICTDHQSLIHSSERLSKALDDKSWTCEEQRESIGKLRKEIELRKVENEHITKKASRLYTGCQKYLL